jgi:hypothetical protein
VKLPDSALFGMGTLRVLRKDTIGALTVTIIGLVDVVGVLPLEHERRKDKSAIALERTRVTR